MMVGLQYKLRAVVMDLMCTVVQTVSSLRE